MRVSEINSCNWNECTRRLFRVRQQSNKQGGSSWTFVNREPYWFDHQERFVSVKWSIRVQLITFAFSFPIKWPRDDDSLCSITATPSLVVIAENTFCPSEKKRQRTVSRGVRSSFSLFNIRPKHFANRFVFDFAISFIDGTKGRWFGRVAARYAI